MVIVLLVIIAMVIVVANVSNREQPVSRLESSSPQSTASQSGQRTAPLRAAEVGHPKPSVTPSQTASATVTNPISEPKQTIQAEAAARRKEFSYAQGPFYVAARKREIIGPLSIRSTWLSATLVGSFTPTGGRSNDIELFVRSSTPDGKLLYASGRAVQRQYLDMLLQPGTYYLVFDNGSSDEGKTITSTFRVVYVE